MINNNTTSEITNSPPVLEVKIVDQDQDNADLLDFIVDLRFKKQLPKSEVAKAVGMSESELDVFFQKNSDQLTPNAKKLIKACKTVKLESLSERSLKLMNESLDILQNIIVSFKNLPLAAFTTDQIKMVESVLNTAARTHKSIEETSLKAQLVDSVKPKELANAEPTFGDKVTDTINIHDAIVALPDRPKVSAPHKASNSTGSPNPPDLSGPSVSTNALVKELRRRQGNLKTATPDLLGLIDEPTPTTNSNDIDDDSDFKPVFV